MEKALLKTRLWEEFLKPIQDRHSDKEITLEDGTRMIDSQMIFLSEPDHFEPIACYDEELEGNKVVGFKVNGFPDQILIDTQYINKEIPSGTIFFEVMKGFTETGNKQSLITYQGFDQVVLREKQEA